MQSNFLSVGRLITNCEEEYYAQANVYSVSSIASAVREQGVSAQVLNAIRQNTDIQYGELQALLVEDTKLNALKHSCLKAWLCEFESFATANKIQALVLKGMALSEVVYKHAGDRPKTDVDLMLNKSDVETLRQHMLGQGFTEVLDTGGLLAGHHQIAFEKKVSGEMRISIDVHWRLTHNQSFKNIPDFDELWQHALAFPDVGEKALGSLRLPSLPYLALHSVIHYYGHHYDSPRLIWVHDLNCVLDEMDVPQKQEFLELLRVKQVANLAREMVALAQKFFKTNSAAELLQALGKQVDSEATDYLLNNSLSRSRYFYQQFMALEDSQSKLLYIKELLLPSRDYMKKRYNLDGNHQLPMQYLKRILRAAN